MFDYIKGILFIVFFLIFLNFFGKKILKEKSVFHYNIVVGYIIYSTFHFLGAFSIGFISNSWVIYKIYMIVFLLLCIIWLLCSYRKIVIKNILFYIGDHLKKYFPIYIIAAILLCFSVMNIDYLWMGNHLDDGFYMMKVSNAANYDTFRVEYTNGFLSNFSLARGFNTYELDYAFWVDLLGIYPSIFCRAIISYFNYFFYIIVFFDVYCILFKKETICWKDTILMSPILLFGLSSEMLVNNGIIIQQDSWHFSNAAWYGSTFVRCTTIPLLYISQQLFNKYLEKLIIFVLTCITLFSKASQALPAVSIVVLSFILVYLISDIYEYFKIKSDVHKYFFLVFLISLFAGYIFFGLKLYPGCNEEIKTVISYNLTNYFKSPIIIAALMIFTITILKTKDISLKKLVLFILGIHIFIFVPIFNFMFIKLSVYSFVAARTITMLSYSVFIISLICLVKLLNEFKMNSKIIITSFGIFGICICLLFMDYTRTNIGIKSTISTLYRNIYLIPDSTKELSDYLADLSKKDDITVMTPHLVIYQGRHHALGIFVKTTPANYKCVSSLSRYPIVVNSEFDGFNNIGETIFNAFNSNPYSKVNVDKFFSMINDYPINIFAFTNPDAVNIAERFGFDHINTITSDDPNLSYYIVKR